MVFDFYSVFYVEAGKSRILYTSAEYALDLFYQVHAGCVYDVDAFYGHAFFKLRSPESYFEIIRIALDIDTEFER